MELGREYPFSEIPSGKCLVHESVATKLKVKKGFLFEFIRTKIGDLIFASFPLNYTTWKILLEAYNYKYYMDNDKYLSFTDAST